MKSDRGEIEVFLCPEEETLGMTSEESANEDTDSEATLNSPLKIKKELPDSSLLSLTGNTSADNTLVATEGTHFLASDILSNQTASHSSASHVSAVGANGGPMGGGGSPPGATWEAPSRTDGDDDQAMKNVLILESEDFGPIGNRFQQQTVDQDHHHCKYRHVLFTLFVDCLLWMSQLLKTPRLLGRQLTFHLLVMVNK